MILPGRLTLLTCAVVIAGCAETPPDPTADSNEQVSVNTVSQDPVYESTNGAENGNSEPTVVNQPVNPVVDDDSALPPSHQSPNTNSKATEQPASPIAEISEERSSFNAHMSAAHRAIEEAQWEDASRSLDLALQLNPNSAAARDLQELVATQQELLRQQDLVRRFTAAIQVEHWSEANEVAKNMKTQNPATLAQIQRSETLESAEQLVDRLLSEPKRLSRPSVQSEVSRLRNLTESVDPGKRVGEKLSRLRELSLRWTTPVVLTLNSDGATTVILRPGRSMGQFRTQKIQLMPGEYVLIGRRDGFREVRRSLHLNPNSEPTTIEIKATERF